MSNGKQSSQTKTMDPLDNQPLEKVAETPQQDTTETTLGGESQEPTGMQPPSALEPKDCAEGAVGENPDPSESSDDTPDEDDNVGGGVSDRTLMNISTTDPPTREEPGKDPKTPASNSPVTTRSAKHGTNKGFYKDLINDKVREPDQKTTEKTTKTNKNDKGRTSGRGRGSTRDSPSKNSIKEELDRMIQLNREQTGEINKLQGELKTIQKRCKALEALNNSQKEQIKKKEKTNETAGKTAVTLEKRNKSLQEAKDKLQSTLDIIQAGNRTLNSKITALENSNADLNNKISTLENHNADLTTKTATQETENINLKEQNRQLTTEIDAKVLEAANLRSELTDKQTVIEGLELDITCLNTANGHQETITPETRKLDELEQDLQQAYELISTLYEKLEQLDQEEDVLVVPDMTAQLDALKAMLIADSNRRNIVPNLDKGVDWDQIEEIFTVGMLSDYISQDTIPDVYDLMAIMQGTNDIKHGKDGRRTAKKLANLVRQIEQEAPLTKVAVIEIPPLKDTKLNKERQLFNLTIREEGINVIRTEKILNKIEIETGNVLIHDGIHLHRDAAKEIANQINSETETITPRERTPHMHKDDRQPTSDEDENSISWQIPSAAVGRVVGKGGWNINKMAEDNHVKISIGQKEPDDTQTITIKGNPRDIDAAAAEVHKHLEQHKQEKNRHIEKKAEAQTQECSFFKRGKCTRGSRCMFRHDIRQTQPSTSSSNRNRSHSPHHKEHSSRNRSHSPHHREHTSQQTSSNNSSRHNRNHSPHRREHTNQHRSHSSHHRSHTEHRNHTNYESNSRRHRETRPQIRKANRSRSPVARR